MPATTPALATALTGLWPGHHGSRGQGQPLRRSTTVASLLAARGYRTVGVSASPAAGPRQGLHQGFERFVQAERLESPRGIDVAKAALAAAADLPTGEPLFVWAHLTDAAFPWLPNGERAPDSPAAGCDALVARVTLGELSPDALSLDDEGGSSAALAACSAALDQAMRDLDAGVASLLEGLGGRRDLSAAVVVLASDHGLHLGEAGLYFTSGPELVPAATDALLAIQAPGVSPRAEASVARLEDLTPTLLVLSGASELPVMDGAPLDLWSTAAGPLRTAVAEGTSDPWPGHPALFAGVGGPTPCFQGQGLRICGHPDGPPTVEADAAHPPGESEISAAFAAMARWSPDAARQRGAFSEAGRLVLVPRAEGGFEERWAGPDGAPLEPGALPLGARLRLQAATDDLARSLPVAPLTLDLERALSSLSAGAEP